MAVINNKTMKSISEKNRQYRRTINGFINNIYRNQKSTSLKRKFKPPEYTLKELRCWCVSNSKFLDLFNYWKDSGFNKRDAPSLDRIDDYKHYTINNIQVMTWEENRIKSYKDKKSGRNNKVNVMVNKFSIENIFICSYHSISYASRENNISKSVVFNSCKDGRIIDGKYHFQKV